MASTQVVVGELGAAGEGDLARVGVDADDLVHEHLGVLLAAQNGADGLGDVRRGEHGEGYLVKQRLKGVVVAAVNYRYVDGEPCKAVSGVDAGKATADDNHAGAAGLEGFGWLDQKGKRLRL